MTADRPALPRSVPRQTMPDRVPDRPAAELSGSLPSGPRFALRVAREWIVLRVHGQVVVASQRWMPPDVAVELGTALVEIGKGDRG